MNKTIKQALIGAAAMLAMTGANAETISLIPTAPTVNAGATIDLTVQGTEFFNDVSSGSINVTWNPASFQLNSTLADITSSAATNGFTIDFGVSSVSAGAISATYGAFATVPGPTFDFISFQLIALSSGIVDIGVGSFGDWQDGAGTGITNPTYVDATITVVNEVPLPAAAWLFGSGLLGLVGIARRRSAQAQS